MKIPTPKKSISILFHKFLAFSGLACSHIFSLFVSKVLKPKHLQPSFVHTMSTAGSLIVVCILPQMPLSNRVECCHAERESYK